MEKQAQDKEDRCYLTLFLHDEVHKFSDNNY